MKRSLLVLGLAPVLAGLVVSPALGQAPSASPSGHAHGQGKGPDKDDKERHKGKDEKADKKEDKVGDPDIEKLKDEWKKKHAEWVDKRKERRDAARTVARTELGVRLSNPAIIEELKRHARRVARLERIIFLADAGEKTELAKKARDLLAKEEARHEKRLEALKSQPAPASKQEVVR